MSQLPFRVLIADDQSDVLEALRLLLKGEGFAVETAESPAATLRAVEAAEFDAALIDLNYTRDTTSGREGLTLLGKLQALDPTLPVIMTAWSSIESAVEAIQLGARDYLEKPWDNARLLAMLGTQIELGRAIRASRRLVADNQRLRGTDAHPTLVAESRPMQVVLAQLERIAPSDVNVLITGEHGTGKDVVARWIHAASRRDDRPFITVNAGGIADTLFESELFGHVKGAFTDAKTDRVGSFELADGGTLFLDEIANVSLKQQAKLLRVLESGDLQRVGSSRVRRVDVRVLAATNADLARDVAEGRFREDLLYRLNTVEIRLPPLSERRRERCALYSSIRGPAMGASCGMLWSAQYSWRTARPSPRTTSRRNFRDRLRFQQRESSPTTSPSSAERLLIQRALTRTSRARVH